MVGADLVALTTRLFKLKSGDSYELEVKGAMPSDFQHIRSPQHGAWGAQRRRLWSDESVVIACETPRKSYPISPKSSRVVEDDDASVSDGAEFSK